MADKSCPPSGARTSELDAAQQHLATVRGKLAIARGMLRAMQGNLDRILYDLSDVSARIPAREGSDDDRIVATKDKFSTRSARAFAQLLCHDGDHLYQEYDRFLKSADYYQFPDQFLKHIIDNYRGATRNRVSFFARHLNQDHQDALIQWLDVKRDCMESNDSSLFPEKPKTAEELAEEAAGWPSPE